MGKFKTLPANARNPDIDHLRTCQLRVLSQDDFRNYNVEIDILSSGPVQGGTWEFRNLEKYAHTFCGVPILCAYVFGKIGDGHNAETRIGRDGKEHRSHMGATSERIVGAISDKPGDVWVHEKNGKTWVTARGKLWRMYAEELVDKIARQGRMDVSSETEVTEETMERDGQREIYNDWTGFGVTILGDDVAPAVPNAHLRKLAAMQQEFKTMKLRVAALEKPNHEPQVTNNKGVNLSMNKALLACMAKLFFSVRCGDKTDSYDVVCCSEDENHVLLMAKDGTMCSYQFKEGEAKDTVIPSRIKAINLSAEYAFEDGVKMALDTGTVFTALSEKLTVANASLADVQAKLTTAQATITTMETAENARRALAAEHAVTEKLAASNALLSADEQLDSKLAEPILADCKAGKFNACADKDGNWTGCGEAVSRLMALIGEESMKREEQRRASSQKHYAWENPNAHESGNTKTAVENFLDN